MPWFGKQSVSAICILIHKITLIRISIYLFFPCSLCITLYCILPYMYEYKFTKTLPTEDQITARDYFSQDFSYIFHIMFSSRKVHCSLRRQGGFSDIHLACQKKLCHCTWLIPAQPPRATPPYSYALLSCSVTQILDPGQSIMVATVAAYRAVKAGWVVEGRDLQKILFSNGYSDVHEIFYEVINVIN